MSNNAVVLLSGGQDSTTCLKWAEDKFDEIVPVSFDYGQKHAIELIFATKIAKRLGYEETHKVFSIPFLSELPAALTKPEIVEVEAEASDKSLNVFAYEHGLPSTFVPGRNMLFFTTAIAYGATIGAYNLVTGVCQQDAAGYPDCRAEFVNSAQSTLRLALDDDRVKIHAPLVNLSKAETWALAETLGCLEMVKYTSHTCYHGIHNKKNLHEWGHGCGECPACVERAKGYAEFIEGKTVNA